MSNTELTDRFTGVRLHWLWRPGDAAYYHYETVFLSEELGNEYDQYAAHFQEEPLKFERVLDIEDTASVPVESVIHSDQPLETLAEFIDIPLDRVNAILKMAQLQNSDRAAAIIPSALHNAASTGNVSGVLVTASSPAVSSAHPLRKHFMTEKSLREDPALTDLSSSASDSKYSGPLFVYALDRYYNQNKQHRLLERKAPINVTWAENQQNRYTIGITTEMKKPSKSTTWSSQYNRVQGLRHVLLSGQATSRGSGQDDDVARSTGIGAAQWHCRAFSIPESMDTQHNVAGQAHRDPWDHNKIGNKSWKYDKSRDEVWGFWDSEGCSRSSIDTKLRSTFQSHDGRIFGINC